MTLIPREDSARTLAEGEKLIGRAHPAGLVQLSVHVRPEGDTLAEIAEQRSVDPVAIVQLAARLQRTAPTASQSPGRLWQADWQRATPTGAAAYLTRQQFAEAHAAKPADLARIHQFARLSGFEVVPDLLAHRLAVTPRAHRTVELVGTVAAANRAFGINLVRVRRADGSVYRTHLGPYHVPAHFDSAIANVFGLDNRPQVTPRARLAPHLGGTWPTGGYWPADVAKAYDFPNNVTGAGQTIAIVEFGGGYRWRDLWRYFRKVGVAMPKVKAVGVGGARNRPTGNPNGPDGEVLLDIEIAGAIAPGARIVVYFAPNSNRGFFKAVNAAIHDAVNKPTILSISWGQPEGSWTIRDMWSMTEAFQAAERLGITVFAASGDNGSTDGVKGVRAHVDFPASCPWVTGCGGTTLHIDPSGKRERVWNDGDNGGTGGGVSTVFHIPKYQSIPQVLARVGAPMRGVPDVAGCADPNTGYNVRIDGVDTIVGGTSAVAPLWAGLTALLNQSLGYEVGFLNPLLYLTNLKQGLNDIQLGDNDTTGRLAGMYQAGPGWDPCTGFGSPDGAGLLSRFSGTV